MIAAEHIVVVGAGSAVVGDLPSYVLAAFTPARIVRHLTQGPPPGDTALRGGTP